MSEIKTNKLTGTSTAGSILVTGEGNSTTTSLQQGLAKTWVAATLAAVIYDSFNISSNTDEGTGDYKYGISNALSRSSAETHVSGISLGYTNIIRVKTSESSTSMIDIESMNTSASATDGHHSVGVHGDLA
tara:strand:- start:457 stop:849 length:393 start_codon:yes stop_codon:yes gene_type:complete